MQSLDSLLVSYAAEDAAERAAVIRMRELLTQAAPFDRESFAPGHFTASAFILSPERDALLLILHKKLGIWVQPGGHADPGDSSLEMAALREAEEEVGIRELAPLDHGGAIFDLDIHGIPARKLEPAHEHFDVRFAFVAPSRELRPSDEVGDCRWVLLADVERANSDPSVLRAARKLSRLL